MKQKRRIRRTGDRISGLREVAVSGSAASNRLRDVSIKDEKFTYFKTRALGGNYKLVNAYERVLNFVEADHDLLVDLGSLVVTGIYKATKKNHPGFPANEAYMSNSSNSFIYPNGKIIVIVIESLWSQLRTRIDRYVLDLAREGYWADVYTVKNATEKKIKDLIKSSNYKGALLVGKIPAAIYKHDGGTFPCDLYYMDKNGTWNETSTDGVYDGHSGNVNPELWIGRLYTPTNDGNDTALLKEYFDRNHNFRTGMMDHRRNALALVDDDWAGYPKKIKKAWEGFPSDFQNGVDAAVKWPLNNKIYFFKGSKYIRYDYDKGEVDNGYPKNISTGWKNLPSTFHSNLDAVVSWPTNDKIYFFKGNKYIRYDASNNKMDSGYPKLIKTGWKEVPNSFQSNLDAAFTWPNGKMYMFKGDEYIRYDTASNQMDPGYPKNIGHHWRGFSDEFKAKVDASVLLPNNFAYIFSGNMYVKYDTGSNKVYNAGFDDCAFDSMFPSNVIDVITHPNETRASVYKEELLKPRSWVQLCAHSNTGHHAFSADPPSGSVNSAYLRDTEPPQAFFYNLFCCSSGKFTTNEYIAGWYIFDKTGGGNCQGLAAISSAKSGSMLYFEDFYGPLGTGKDIGTAFKDWFVKRGPDHDDGEVKWFYGMAVLGDPTLTWYKGCIPLPVTPNNGEVYNHFPRGMTCEWQPVNIPGVKYDVEIDPKGLFVAGKWSTEVNQIWKLKQNLTGTSYSFDFVGAQRGRWRVRAKFGNVRTQWSKWQYFRFTR